jgi:hypothetical protein
VNDRQESLQRVAVDYSLQVEREALKGSEIAMGLHKFLFFFNYDHFLPQRLDNHCKVKLGV